MVIVLGGVRQTDRSYSCQNITITTQFGIGKPFENMRGWQSFSMTISLSLLAVLLYSGCSLLSQTERFNFFSTSESFVLLIENLVLKIKNNTKI